MPNIETAYDAAPVEAASSEAVGSVSGRVGLPFVNLTLKVFDEVPAFVLDPEVAWRAAATETTDLAVRR